MVEETRSEGEREKEKVVEIESEEIGESVVGHRANTSEDCRFCDATSPAPHPPAEILTFPKIRNLPEGHGLIPSTCHVRCPSWRLDHYDCRALMITCRAYIDMTLNLISNAHKCISYIILSEL